MNKIFQNKMGLNYTIINLVNKCNCFEIEFKTYNKCTVFNVNK